MKQSISLICTALLCLMLSSMHAQTAPATKDPFVEALSKSTIKALSAKDSMALQRLMVTEEEYLELVTGTERYKAATEAKQKETVDRAKHYMEETHFNTMREFREMTTEGEQNGIVWANISYESCNYSVDHNAGMELASLKIVFSYNGKKYTIVNENVLHVGYKWRYLGSIGQVLTDAEMRARIAKEQGEEK